MRKRKFLIITLLICLTSCTIVSNTEYETAVSQYKDCASRLRGMNPEVIRVKCARQWQAVMVSIGKADVIPLKGIDL